MEENKEELVDSETKTAISEPELTIEEKIDNLLKISDRVWCHYGLLFSNYYDKLTKADIDYIIDNVSNLSKEVSDEMKKTYPNMEAMFDDFHLERCVEDEKQDSWGREVFGYFVTPNKIYTVKRTIRKLTNYIHSLDDKYKLIFKEKEIHKVILAHEFFHFYEEKNKKTIFTKSYKVNVFKILGFHYKSRVQAISEIAAMEFARHYNSISYNPYLLNYILLAKVSPEQADSIYKTVMDLNIEEGNNGTDNI